MTIFMQKSKVLSGIHLNTWKYVCSIKREKKGLCFALYLDREYSLFFSFFFFGGGGVNKYVVHNF